MCEPDFQVGIFSFHSCVQRDRLVGDLVRRSRRASTTGRPARRGRRRRCSARAAASRCDAVHERLADGEHRRHRLLGLLVGADDAPDDPAHLAQVDLLRERRRRAAPCGSRRTPLAFARQRRQELAVGGEQLGGLLDRPERRPADDVGDRVRLERELGDDAEVAAAAAQRPEQLRVLVGARGDLLARRPARPRPRAGCRSSGRTRGSDGRSPPPSVSPPTPVVEMTPHGTASPCSCVGRVDLAPRAAAADANRARVGSTDDRAQQRQVDDDAVVDAAEAAAVVAAAADCERQVVRAGEARSPARRRPASRSARSAPAACRSSR